MTARHKVRPRITQSHREMRDVEVKPGQENELAAASERFATTLRTASVESRKPGPARVEVRPVHWRRAPALDGRVRVGLASIHPQVHQSINDPLALQREISK